MVNRDDTPDLADVAARLDRLRAMPDDVLTEVVMRDGLCPWFVRSGDLADRDDAAPTDRELAARLCAGCPVIDECLELDLRVEGQSTTGVWGALPEDDRRALHPIWKRRRTNTDTEGGRRP